MQEEAQALDNDSPVNPHKWANPPTLADLKADQKETKNSHDIQKAKIRKWLDNLNIEGAAKLPKTAGYSNVQPKLIRKQAEWRYASLSEPFLSSDDLYSVKPVSWEDVEPARQNSMLLNHQINTKIDKVQFIDDYVRTGVDEGTIIVKVGWKFEEEEVTVSRPEVSYTRDETLAALHQELAALVQESPTEYKSQVPEELRMAHEKSMELGVALRPIITGYREVVEMRTIANHPTLEICDYRHVAIDPSCRGNIDDAGFTIHEFETSLSELKKDGRYFNLDRINLEANSPLGAPDHESPTDENFKFLDDPRKRIIAYEYWGYWDYNNTGITKPFVATWVGETLIRLEETPFPDKKLPFVVVPLLPVRRSVYGEPDGELLEDNQKIVGAITRGMIDIMGRSANGQTGTRKDALDAVNRRRYQQGKDYEYNAGVDPRMAFYQHVYPEIPQSAQYMLEQQNYDAEAMTGVKAFSGGINSGALGEVATGIRGAIDAAGKRETGILRRLAKGMVQVGRKIVSMNAEFLEDEEIIRVTNEEFIAIRRDDLAGNFDLRMDISTPEEDNVKAQELAFMLQTMGPHADAGIVKIILRDIARLRKMPQLAHEIEQYEPQPDPLDVEIKQLEVQKLKAEIAAIHAGASEDMAGANLDNARAQKEGANARKLHSEADKMDLDFVEQESGVTQEREKEKIGEQAKGNIALRQEEARLDRGEARTDELKKFLGQAA